MLSYSWDPEPVQDQPQAYSPMSPSSASSGDEHCSSLPNLTEDGARSNTILDDLLSFTESSLAPSASHSHSSSFSASTIPTFPPFSISTTATTATFSSSMTSKSDSSASMMSPTLSTANSHSNSHPHSSPLPTPLSVSFHTFPSFPATYSISAMASATTTTATPSSSLFVTSEMKKDDLSKAELTVDGSVQGSTDQHSLASHVSLGLDVASSSSVLPGVLPSFLPLPSPSLSSPSTSASTSSSSSSSSSTAFSSHLPSALPSFTPLHPDLDSDDSITLKPKSKTRRPRSAKSSPTSAPTPTPTPTLTGAQKIKRKAGRKKKILTPSDIATRRRKHNEIEIRRRQKITQKFAELRRLTQCADESKGAILSSAIERINELEAQLAQYTSNE